MKQYFVKLRNLEGFNAIFSIIHSTLDQRAEKTNRVDHLTSPCSHLNACYVNKTNNNAKCHANPSIKFSEENFSEKFSFLKVKVWLNDTTEVASN